MNKVSTESRGNQTTNDKEVNSSDLLYLISPKEINPAVDGTPKDYFFGNLKHFQDYLRKLNKDNIDEIKPRLEWYIGAALSWESVRLED